MDTEEPGVQGTQGRLSYTTVYTENAQLWDQLSKESTLPSHIPEV